MKRMLSLIITAAMLLSLFACAKRPASEPEPEPEVSEELAGGIQPEPAPAPMPEPTPTPEPTQAPVRYRNFLNGEPLDEPDYTRPFAVMINNIIYAQPQCGVGDADIVYEVLAEGGITRMMAIFSHIGDAGILGSIRSIRPYYVDIALAYGAIPVHSGGSVGGYGHIAELGVNNIDGGTTEYTDEAFYRDQARMANGYEHSMFTTGSGLLTCAEKLGYALEVSGTYSSGLSFSSAGNAAPAGGEDAAEINITFSSVGSKTTKLHYHEDTGVYTAEQHSGDYVDGNTGEALAFTNVLVISAETVQLDGEGRLSVELTGRGGGYFACGGKYSEIEWSRAGLTSPFVYTLSNAVPLDLGVGKTYIAVVPTTGSEVTFS